MEHLAWFSSCFCLDVPLFYTKNIQVAWSGWVFVALCSLKSEHKRWRHLVFIWIFGRTSHTTCVKLQHSLFKTLRKKHHIEGKNKIYMKSIRCLQRALKRLNENAHRWRNAYQFFSLKSPNIFTINQLDVVEHKFNKCRYISPMGSRLISDCLYLLCNWQACIHTIGTKQALVSAVKS